jgi:hypothetical protein
MKKETVVEFFRSKLFAGIVIGICIMLVVICIFEVGVIVGYHEADFSNRWSENYNKNFAQSNSFAGTMGIPDSHVPSPDGILGKIISASTDSSGTTTLVVSSPQKPEEKIIVDGNTVIRDHENTVTASSLTTGTYAVVIGAPNSDGELHASLVRIVPSPEELSASTTNSQ